MPATIFSSHAKDLPVTQLTKGNKHHWFGYYDKIQMDPTGRYVLGMQSDFCFRSPTANDVIKIGMVDLENNNKWTEIGTSRSWGWQPGHKPGMEFERHLSSAGYQKPDFVSIPCTDRQKNSFRRIPFSLINPEN